VTRLTSKKEQEFEAVERPIIFSGSMVRAILENRKTQTRRVIKPQPFLQRSKDGDGSWWFLDRSESGYGPTNSAWREGEPPYWTYCPYGKPGDRLWVRETFVTAGGNQIRYAATDDIHELRKKKPAMHMPRSYSRITLEIIKVRMERLQEISEEDAEAEGVAVDHRRCTNGKHQHGSAAVEYRSLWDSINAKREGGKYAWDKNSWVWVIEFRQVNRK
jgi:hypothetical protein